MARRDPEATRQRLRGAAAALFAAHGFHGTTVREIAERAGVNLAAGNYHFGSKRELYLEVLREEFARVRELLRARGAVWRPDELRAMSRAALSTLLQRRIEIMLRMLIGPPPSLHSTLMQREMLDPSEALPVIVREFVTPMMDEMKQIVARLAPGLADEAIERCTCSIVGQALFYRTAMPAVLQRWELKRYTPALAAELAGHITAFSAAGITAARPARARRRRAR